MSEFSYQDFSTLYQNKFLCALFIYNRRRNDLACAVLIYRADRKENTGVLQGLRESRVDIVHATVQDEERVQRIVETTIREIYPNYYPSGVVDFFLAYHSPERVKIAIENNEVYLIYAGGIAVGTGSIKANEISRLFILPEYQRQGYGNRLMDFLERCLLAQYDSITLDASLPAARMYMRRGYSPASFEQITTGCGHVLCYSVMKFSG